MREEHELCTPTHWMLHAPVVGTWKTVGSCGGIWAEQSPNSVLDRIGYGFGPLSEKWGLGKLSRLKESLILLLPAVD